jgi:hypothetical protein
MLTEQDALAAVRASLEDVREAVRTAQHRLDAGFTVDLTGMDARMAALCAQALDLPPPQARATVPDLMAVRDSIDGLIAMLTPPP